MNPKISYSVVLAGYFSLLVLTILWPTLLSPPEHLPVAFILIVFSVPLLFPLRGVLYARNKSFIWTAYLSLFYFAHGVTESGAGTGDTILAILEIIASMVLFFGIIGYLKATS